MAATGQAVLGRFSGASWAAAFGVNSNNANLDLLQIVNVGDTIYGASPVIMVNVDYQGNVHNPPVSPTNGTTIGQFFTTAANGSTTAQFFAGAFTNPLNLDIVQLASATGGNILKYIDYLGVSH